MVNFTLKNNNRMSYPIICDSYPNSDIALETWIEFTGYLKPEEISFIESIKEKDFTSFTDFEMDEYHRIKKQKAMHKLLEQYQKRKCTLEEHNQVVEYMYSSLTELVESRLDVDEIEIANRHISELEENGMLENYVESHQGIYENLSIYEAYVLFKAKEKIYELMQLELREQMKNKLIENDNNKQRTLKR